LGREVTASDLIHFSTVELNCQFLALTALTPRKERLVCAEQESAVALEGKVYAATIESRIADLHPEASGCNDSPIQSIIL
jgi:hypothetical protein